MAAQAARLLVLCEYATLNGGEQSLLATLPTVIAAGFEVLIALPPSGPLHARLSDLGVMCLPLELRGSGATAGQRRPLPELRTELAALLQRVQPALVHANSLAMGRLIGPVAKELGLRSLAHLRDIVGLSATARGDLNCLTRLIAVSHATRAAHVSAGLDGSKMQVLYNGVCLETFQPRAATGYLHRELQLPPEVPLLATIGQLGLRKDPLTLLEAAQEVLQQHPTAHFLLVGERNSDKPESVEYEAALHQLASQPPLAGQVHFVGVRSDVAQLLPELTLLVHPARQEPLGRVLLEAGACGVLIVASDVGGTREIFPAESEAAQLFTAGNKRELAAVMSKLLSDAAKRATLGRHARQRIAATFDIRQQAAELVQVYRELL